MCHARGGNLRDPEVFDTPPIPEEVDHCDVIRGTLFIDWQGKAFICDHDVHGEHCLGDLLAEPISAVLERRESLVREGVRFVVADSEMTSENARLREQLSQQQATNWSLNAAVRQRPP